MVKEIPFDLIAEICKVISSSDVEEIEITVGSLRIRAVRDVSYVSPQPLALKDLTDKPSDDEESKYRKISSPMMGTFYRAPSPEAPPFVEEGDVVEEGTILCILEAMKLMYELKAEIRCRIVKILKENGQQVHPGEPIFLVEPI